MENFKLAAVPAELTWHNSPVNWQLTAQDELIIEAGPKTDLFVDPAGANRADNAPAALFNSAPPTGDFLLSARVKVEFGSTYDAGVLQIYAGEALWAKLCFEYSPQARPTVVSVVTRGESDDANSVPVEANEVYLRIARTGRTFSFHYSEDAQFWHLVRYFTLGDLADFKVGFSSQSPTGPGCTATFSQINYQPVSLQDNRNGA